MPCRNYECRRIIAEQQAMIEALADRLREIANDPVMSTSIRQACAEAEAKLAALSPQARPDGGVKVPERCDHGRTMDEACDNYGCDREAHPAPALEDYPEAAEVCAEAYQAVGIMLDDLGQFESKRGTKLLDNLSQHRMVHKDVLPWPSMKPAPDVARLVELLKAAVCPMKAEGCDGTQYPVQPYGEGEQCQWCYERREALAPFTAAQQVES